MLRRILRFSLNFYNIPFQVRTHLSTRPVNLFSDMINRTIIIEQDCIQHNVTQYSEINAVK